MLLAGNDFYIEIAIPFTVANSKAELAEIVLSVFKSLRADGVGLNFGTLTECSVFNNINGNNITF